MNFSLSRSSQLIVLGCVLLLFFLYVAWPANYFFLNDDFIHVPLAGGGSLFNRSFIRPVSDITLYTDHLLWGKNAAGYHLTNILLHLLNTVCLFILSSKLFTKFSPAQGFDARPWMASFIFLLNGCASESVFWIIGRGGSLAGLFAMLSLITYLDRRIIFSLLFFIIGVFAYEAVLALPLIITVFYAVEKKPKAAGPVIGFWAICLLYLGYRFVANGALLNAYEQGSGFNVMMLLYNFNALVARTLIPPVGSAPALLIAYVVVLLLIAGVLTGFIMKGKDLLAARTLFLCMLAAVLPFITLGADTHDSEAGRFVYLSVIFASMLLAELLGRAGWVLVAVHAFFFFNSGMDYQYAGRMARQTLDCLRGVNDNTRVVDAPSQYRGALIFRSGLPEAIYWYNAEKNSVSIASLKEIEHKARLTCEKKADSITFSVQP